MHRFFVSPNSITQRHAEITGPLVHQMKNVLRLRPGDHVMLLDDSGWAYKTELVSLEENRIIGQVIQKSLVLSEPRTKITLFHAVLKANKFEWVLQKGTELGVVGFVPMICQRCVMSNLEAVGDHKIERWKRIISEAAEQSRRGRLPRLRPVQIFSQACEQAHMADLSIIPWEQEKRTSIRDLLRVGSEYERPFSVNIFIGPEGGLTYQEVELARRHGIIPVTLGPRILRAETASLVAATAILYELGDLE